MFTHCFCESGMTIECPINNQLLQSCFHREIRREMLRRGRLSQVNLHVNNRDETREVGSNVHVRSREGVLVARSF